METQTLPRSIDVTSTGIPSPPERSSPKAVSEILELKITRVWPKGTCVTCSWWQELRGAEMSEREQQELKRELALAYMAEARRRHRDYSAPPGYLEKSLELLSEEPPTLKPAGHKEEQPDWLESP